MNKLIHETSPYLLQHAHNPVNWYPWGEEALNLAKQLDKPILVSIGYSACHWCHVMERESFENEATAALMNEHFVNIKIDREERPDLDHVYMDAVQTMTGGGGWPLNVFLTPAGKPFYGGTYYPPMRAYNRASWQEVLLGVHEAYRDRKDKVLEQADGLTEHLNNASFGMSKPGEEEQAALFSPSNLALIASNILQQADIEWGGFGQAPKFPQTFSIQYLLRHHYFTNDEAVLQQALLSLDKMMQGGIYDHVGGGFARYSTDTQWLVPHFEKMLYDNALLLQAITEAYQLTGDEKYADTIRQTFGWLQREMLSPEGGFYSAIDADSEGVEGKYYVWSKAEIEDVLGDDSELFCSVYDISEHGNWEESNIPWLKTSLTDRVSTLNIDENIAREKLKTCLEKLLQQRQKRIKPGLDDKILTGWNALTISACCKAYAALGEEIYLQTAESCMAFLEEKCSGDGKFKHTYKNGVAKYHAFLDDCAYLVQAYINLQEVTGNQDYLLKARQLTESTVADFSDEDGIFFYFTPAGQDDIIVRKKEIYDGATPSGNAVMAYNLHYLSVVFDVPVWRKRAEHMVTNLGQMITKYPTSFGYWASVFQNLVQGLNEIAIVGPDAAAMLAGANRLYLPARVMQSSLVAVDAFPLLAGKTTAGLTLVYLCKNYECSLPSGDLEGLKKLELKN